MSKTTPDDEKSEVDFPVPKGYRPPVSSRIGEEFTVLASFKIDEDEPDRICLTKIENVPVSGAEPDESDEEPETSPALMAAIQQSSATNASQGAPAAASA